MAFNRAFFKQQDTIGQRGERAFYNAIKGSETFPNVMKVDFKTHHYDFQTDNEDFTKKINWEIKTVKKVSKAWDNYTAEIITYDEDRNYHKDPEYITYSHEIDYIVYYDENRNQLCIYDNKVFVGYVLANKNKAFKTQYNNAYCIKFARENKQAGWLSTIQL